MTDPKPMSEEKLTEIVDTMNLEPPGWLEAPMTSELVREVRRLRARERELHDCVRDLSIVLLFNLQRAETR